MRNRLNLVNMLCRICAKEDPNSIPIFGESGKKQNILLKMKACLPVIVSEKDTMPKQICLSCLTKLDASWELHVLCKEAQTKIEKKLNSSRFLETSGHGSLVKNVADNNCGICNEEVQEHQLGVGCEGMCGKWFHCSCVKVNWIEYLELVENPTKIWTCSKCPFPLPIENQQCSLIKKEEDQTCGVCGLEVHDSSLGVGCEGKCQKWYHCSCVKMSLNEYNELVDDPTKTWICPQCPFPVPIKVEGPCLISIEDRLKPLTETRPVGYMESAVICLAPESPPPPPVVTKEPTLVEAPVLTQTAAPTSDPLLGAQPVMVSPAPVTYLQPAAVQPTSVQQTAPAPTAMEEVHPVTLIQAPTNPASEPMVFQNRQAPVPTPRRRAPVPVPKPLVPSSTASPQRTSSVSTTLRRQNSDAVNGPPYKKAPQMCKYCNKSFPDDIIDHHVSLHLRQSFMTCIDCNKNFRSQVAMDKHRCGVNETINLDPDDEEPICL